MEKKCYNNRAIFSYTDWWKKNYGWWGHGLIMMVTQFVIFQDTAVTSPEKDLKYFALKPLAIPLEWVFSIFTAFLWYKLAVKKLLSIFFLCYWVRDLVWNKVRLWSSQWPSLGQRKVPMVGWWPLQRWRHKSNIISSCEDQGQTKSNWIHREVYL